VDLIVSIAIADIVAQEERIAALEQAVRMLRLKLKVVNPRAGAVDLMLSSSGQHLAERERLQARIDETERDLADASRGLGDIAQYLERLIALLDHAEQHIGLERMHLWLDRMNIVRDRYDKDASEIELVRGRRPDQPGRVAQFIRFPRRLIMSGEERLSEVERQLGL
jgi:predicted  nucleic acid-binding Zn-ribbon protein